MRKLFPCPVTRARVRAPTARPVAHWHLMAVPGSTAAVHAPAPPDFDALLIEFPRFPHPVVFEEKPYDSSPFAASLSAATFGSTAQHAGVGGVGAGRSPVVGECARGVVAATPTRLTACAGWWRGRQGHTWLHTCLLWIQTSSTTRKPASRTLCQPSITGCVEDGLPRTVVPQPRRSPPPTHPPAACVATACSRVDSR